MGGDTNLHNNWSYVKQMKQDSLKKNFTVLPVKSIPGRVSQTVDSEENRRIIVNIRLA
jgi:hypothetical protein